LVAGMRPDRASQAVGEAAVEPVLELGLVPTGAEVERVGVAEPVDERVELDRKMGRMLGSVRVEHDDQHVGASRPRISFELRPRFAWWKF